MNIKYNLQSDDRTAWRHERKMEKSHAKHVQMAEN